MTTTAGVEPLFAKTKMESDREVIEGALALIEPDGGWTQGTYCRDADGNEVQPAGDSPGEWVRVRTEHIGAGGYRVRSEPAAAPCSFCLEGALRTAAECWPRRQSHTAHEQLGRLELLLVRLATSAAAPDLPSLHAYNDDPHTTQADVVLLLKRAAAYLDS